MIWQGRHFHFAFPRPALIMGVLNVTPDSFSDGGRFDSTESAVAHGLALIEQGADILDIGGESTRPGAQPVPEAEELRRVLPVLQALSNQIKPNQASPSSPQPANPVHPVLLSIDTMKPAVACAALDSGAVIVNDISSGNRTDSDPAMWRLIAQSGAGYILMHLQGAPQTMQINPQYSDVIAEVSQLFHQRLELLHRHGVKPAQVALDVGIGFGKNVEHNLQLLAQWSHFRQWNRPLVLAVSRKSFLERVSGPGSGASGRLAPSLACASWAVARGAEIIRCHDVVETRQAVRMIEALNTRAVDTSMP